MKHVLTGLVCAIAAGVMGQPSLADPVKDSPARSMVRVPVDHNSPELRVRRSSFSAFDPRFSAEVLRRGTPDAIQAYKAHLTVAECVVDLSGNKAGRLLGGVGTDDLRYRRLNAAMRRQYNTCTSVNSLAGLSPSLLNAAIAERLVLS